MKSINLNYSEYLNFKQIAKFKWKFKDVLHGIIQIEADRDKLELLGY